MTTEDLKAAPKANVGILIYAVGITLAGIGVVIGTVLRDWGFMGYLGGGILAVAGGSMLVAKLRGGLSYVSIRCPRCRHEQTYASEALEKNRVVPCKGCFEYIEKDGAGVRAVADDHVADAPVFEAPFPNQGLDWGGACALCGAAATTHEECEGSNVKIGVVVNQRITRKIQVPVCAAHSRQNAVRLGAGEYLDGHDNFVLHFRSHAACKRFRQANPMPMTVSAAAVTFGRG